ncbi:hypothetical protein H8959_004545, partial [Pygathrix nigripes]
MSSLKIHGPIRIRSMQTGITKWKEGSFEIVEKENKVSLVVHYNTGGIPRIFQLSHNIKNVVLRPSGAKQSRLMLTLQDNSFLSIDKVPSKDAEEMRLFLDAVHQNRLPAVDKLEFFRLKYDTLKTSENEGVAVLPLISVSIRHHDIPFRKVIGNPGRGSIKTVAGSGIAVTRTIPSLTSASTPLRSGLLENRTEKRKRMISTGSELNEDYPKENDSSSNNKAMTDPSRKYLTSSREKQLTLKQSEENRTSGLLPLQSSSFYGSRAGSKEHSSGGANLDRTNVSSQTPSAKRSLGFLPQPAPLSVKKLRCNQDYTGWNKPRVPLSSHQQQQLQGFSNLGNTCYMNAILQSLFSLQSFANDLLKQGIPWKKIPLNALIRRFAHLLVKKDICNSETKKDLLKKVKNAISATAERFS